MRKHEIVVIPGDGIGPEIVAAALDVLRALEEKEGNFHLEINTHEAGAAYYTKHRKRISEETLEACRSADGILKGPSGDPAVRTPEGTEAGILGAAMAAGLDLFANVRPVKLLPGVRSPLRDFEAGMIDYVFVKEHKEGFLACQDKGVGGAHARVDSLLFTREGIERVMRFAFKLSLQRKKPGSNKSPKVTCVDKSNVLRTYGLFREVFLEVGREFPGVETNALYADACAHDLVRRPDQFDVLVTDYFIGDILSDLGAATVGGLGMCPSGCFSDRVAYFEPVHGSAPHIAGQGMVNPIGQILAVGMLLERIGETAATLRLEKAIWKALSSGAIQLDHRGRAAQGTRAVAEAVIAAVSESG